MIYGHAMISSLSGYTLNLCNDYLFVILSIFTNMYIRIAKTEDAYILVTIHKVIKYLVIQII